jgi:hypothetical protein
VISSCTPLQKAIQGHTEAGRWWEEHFNEKCVKPLHLVPAFTKWAIYRRDYDVCSGTTLATRQVDDVACGAAAYSDRDAVLVGIGSTVYFIRSKALMKLLYATEIEQ